MEPVKYEILAIEGVIVLGTVWKFTNRRIKIVWATSVDGVNGRVYLVDRSAHDGHQDHLHS